MHTHGSDTADEQEIGVDLGGVAQLRLPATSCRR